MILAGLFLGLVGGVIAAIVISRRWDSNVGHK
jgi:hypothetical protein